MDQNYNQLVKLFNELQDYQSKINITIYNIKYILEKMDKDNLHKRGKVRLMRLTEDVTLSIVYDNGYLSDIDGTKFLAGTLVQCGPEGTVYLDDDGDGFYYFPPNLLEPVELDVDSVDWFKVVCQG